MWPLYESDAEQNRGEVEPRWGTDPAREYFEAFKQEWKCVHADSLLRLPVVEELLDDGEIAEVLRKRLRDVATQRAQDLVGHHSSVPLDLPSFWDCVSMGGFASRFVININSTPDAAPKSKRETSAFSWFSGLITIDGTIEVDRADRAIVDEALGRLYTNHIAGSWNLLQTQPEVPVNESDLLSSLLKPNASLEGDPAPVVETRGSGKPGQGFMLQKVDLPILVHVNPKWGAIENRAKTMYDALPEIKCEVLQDLEFFAEPKRLVYGGDKAVSIDSPKRETPDNVAKIKRPLPHLIQVDSLCRGPKPPTPVQDLSSIMLRKVVKSNASVTIVRPVPSSFGEDFSVFLRRSKPVQLFGDQTFEARVTGLHLVSLPNQVVIGDENTVDEAVVPFIKLASNVSKKYANLHISMTSLSLSLPSFWQMEIVKSISTEAKIHRFVVCGDKMCSATASDPELTDDAKTTGDKGDNHSHGSLIVVAQAPQRCQFREQPNPVAPCESDTVMTSKLTSFHIADVGHVTTDELVASFLQFGDKTDPVMPSDKFTTDINPSKIDTKTLTLVEHLARPSVWYLIRAKLIRVESAQSVHILKTVSLEVIETIIRQLHTKLQSFASNPSGAADNDLVDLCSSFRHAVWLHVLRIIVEDFTISVEMRLLVASRLVGSYPYIKALGKLHASALSRLYVSLGGSSFPGQTEKEEETRRQKKPRTSALPVEMTPTKVVCSVRLLDQLHLLEQLSDQHILVIERDLPSPIDFVLDEFNVISLIGKDALEEEKIMRTLTYELASAQFQFTKLWIIIDPDCREDLLHAFYAALTSFRVEFQTFVGGSNEIVAELIRRILDTCSDVALSERRILPKMWFSRPFMLEEESQLERFLSSTRLLNPFAAQSLLHRVSLTELSLKSVEDLSTLVQGSVSGQQLQLLWSMLHIHHGIESVR